MVGKVSDTDLKAAVSFAVVSKTSNSSDDKTCGCFSDGDNVLPCRDFGGGGALGLSGIRDCWSLLAVYAVNGVFISVDSADSRSESG